MDPRRALPSVDRIMSRLTGLPHALLADAARDAIADARATIATGGDVDEEAVVRDAARRVEEQQGARLRPVVNATGVLLHTNLGRAPVGVTQSAAYTNLELDLATGRRGSRRAHAGALLARACGAEAGLVVNNGAAAVLLLLAALARGQGVAVSRGELVEIGGGFRVPEIMAESGCRLVEVGTTNRTRLPDYEHAQRAGVALLHKLHASN